MNYFEKSIKKNIKYILINKFLYKNTKNFPKITKIVLNFKYRNNDFNNINKSLLFLQLLLNKKSTFIASKKLNIKLAIKKGQPVGSKTTLRGKKMYQFIDNLLNDILPNVKKFDHKNIKRGADIFLTLNELSTLKLFEKQYHIINYLPDLKILLSFNKKINYNEIIFVINYLKMYCFKTQF